MAPIPDYRENPSHAVYLSGEINETSISALIPEINRKRLASDLPITLYIDSRGGSTFHARILRGLLKTPPQDSDARRLITVAAGYAGSAAADLLAAGDYAIAYPHAVVHFHGTRQSVSDQHITKELATTMAEALEETNENFALQLATQAFDRFFFRYLVEKSQFPALKKEPGKAQWGDVDCMAERMKRCLDKHRNVPQRALERHRRLTQLEAYIMRRFYSRKKPPESGSPFEAFVLHTLIDYEIKENKRSHDWTFREDGLKQMQEDFFVLRDYRVGEHCRQIESLVKRWGAFCLDPDEQKAYEKVDAAKREEWLVNETGENFRALWYFFVSICRSMQEGENILTAEEAYYFGLVDEVAGRTDLPCFRKLMENQPPAPKSLEEQEQGASAG